MKKGRFHEMDGVPRGFMARLRERCTEVMKWVSIHDYFEGTHDLTNLGGYRQRAGKYGYALRLVNGEVFGALTPRGAEMQQKKKQQQNQPLPKGTTK